MAEDQVACPVCAAPITVDEARPCPRCETPHHGECWDYVGGCAIFGCRPAPAGGASVPAVRGTTTPAARGVGRLARAYLWVVRANWYALLLMGSALGFSPMFSAAVGLGNSLVAVLIGLGMTLYIFAAFFATGVYLLLVPPLMLLGAWLSSRIGGPIQAPAQGARALLDSVEVSPSDGLLLWLVDNAPKIYAAITAFTFLHDPTAAMIMLGGMVFALPVLYGLQGFTRDRVVAIQALQNRLAASMKKG
jgi:hypothetical protein